MLAFHGQETIKHKYLSRVRLHRANGEIVQGRQFWYNGCGNALGCTIHGDDPMAYEDELGIPAPLALLHGWLFESLPVEVAVELPSMFLSVIRPGADLSGVWSQFMVWLLDDPTNGVIQFVSTDRGRNAIRRTAQNYREGAATIEWQNAAVIAETAASGESTQEGYAALMATHSAAGFMGFRSFRRTSASTWMSTVFASAPTFAAEALLLHFRRMVTAQKAEEESELIQSIACIGSFISQANKLQELLHAA